MTMQSQQSLNMESLTQDKKNHAAIYLTEEYSHHCFAQ
jgi:hypothetical protein